LVATASLSRAKSRGAFLAVGSIFNAVAAANALSLVNGASMSYGHHEHHEPLILKFTDDTVIAHAKPPESKFAASQRLPEIAGVCSRVDAVIHVVEDFPLYRLVELPEVD